MAGSFWLSVAAARRLARLAGIGLALWAAAAAGATDVGGPITTDTTWTLAGSPYIVKSNVVVFNSATLTIEAGVEVRFRPGTQLIIQDATLVAAGTAGQRIGLHSDEPGQPGGGVRLRAGFGAAATFTACDLADLETAVQFTDGAGGAASFSQCHFADNGTGISGSNGQPTPVTDCQFDGNGAALDGVNTAQISACAFQGNGTGVDGFAELTYSTLTGNDVGLVVTGQFDALSCNDIFGNTEYNAVMATDVSVLAGPNWWGSIYAEEIAQTIHDAGNDGDLGHFVFWPFLEASHAQAYTCGCVREWTDRLTSVPVDAASCALAYDSRREVVVLFGGETSSVALDDTWEWDGNAWKLVADGGPPARKFHALAYDSTRGVTVLFGGSVPPVGASGDTWEWDGTTWTKVADTGAGPSPRYFHAMAYDSARGVTVLHGGYDFVSAKPVYYGDTWEWDGSTWTVRFTGQQLRRHVLAYDSVRGVTVLFGGERPEYQESGTTYEWNGTYWKTVATSGPGARSAAGMVYDSALGACLLFGGGSDPPLQDPEVTWAWDGTAWTKLADIGPKPGGPMAYDRARGVTVLYRSYKPYPVSTWEFHSWPTPVITQQPVDLHVLKGQPAVLSVGVAESELPISYQWRKGGVALTDDAHISGTQTPTLTIAPAGPADAGDYDILVSLSCGGITSELVTLTVGGEFAVGDLNCDGQIDAFDIDPFVLALTDPAAYTAKWPDCDYLLADTNGDGKVDAFDIDPFVKLLTGG